MKVASIGRPGLRVSAGSLIRSFVLALALAVPMAASSQPAPMAPPQSTRPVPGDLELVKLIWSTMAMVDHANRSGNYSVLRDNSSTGFQINNNPAQLGQIFASLRASRIDLSNTLLLAPTYAAAPQLVQPDVFRVRGVFGLRPSPIAFDFVFQWEQGTWRLYGISIEPQPIATVQPVPQQAAPKPAAQPRRN
ncbi:hypothetical protein [Novosphingobium sp.]|uniref:hypothetical protein n=1 Tax=Novosphingobium sp. TaxID=1874826 RepID=UPI0025F54120|nr:hypothetical protein [Novosphingobium sp.]